MFNISNLLKKNTSDFASVPTRNEIKGILVPDVTLGRYPEIIEKAGILIESFTAKIAEKQGLPPEKIIDNLDLLNVLKTLPQIIGIAAEEAFEFIAFVLEVEVETIKELYLIDIMRIVNKFIEVNEIAQVQTEIGNFMTALKNKSQGKK